jgi:hypothetical protein
MNLLSKLLRNASERLTALRYKVSLRWYRSEFRKRWINRRWRKHGPKPIAPYEKFLMKKAPLNIYGDYLTRTKQWSGSAPMTLPVLKAEIRHRLMRSQLAKAPKHLREGTPEFARAQRRVYGNLPEPERICGTSET